MKTLKCAYAPACLGQDCILHYISTDCTLNQIVYYITLHYAMIVDYTTSARMNFVEQMNQFPCKTNFNRFLVPKNGLYNFSTSKQRVSFPLFILIRLSVLRGVKRLLQKRKSFCFFEKLILLFTKLTLTKYTPL